MRRLSLSTKLFAAALPLVIAVGGLLALTVRSDLDEIDRAESGADLGGVWEPLIAALNAVEAEADAFDGDSEVDSDVATADAVVRRATDQAINELRTSVEKLGAFEAASAHVTAGRSALSAARRNIDMAAIAPDMATEVDPVEAYGTASRELVAVGQLLPSEAGDAELGRELLAVVKLAEANLHANEVLAGTRAWTNDPSNGAPLTRARTAYGNLITTFGEFEAIAPQDWGTEFRQSAFMTTLGRFNADLTTAARGTATGTGAAGSFDIAAFDTFVDQVVEFERTISQSIVDGANAEADATSSATMRRIGVILAVVLIAAVIAWFITRSVTRRVKAVAHSANRVAADQLPALVEALRDPRGKAVLPEVEPVDARGGDDLADLAKAFNSMQETLIDVAHEQVEVLRRGVSDIFITMARRNRSLIDRQLSMLDEFEASVDDHEVLSNYYQLDHLATRMRRNSESLLVLANAEPKRRRVKATEIDDVVRASIGEVEDYRRVEIQHLESLQVRGNVVADVSHLLAELLDNATSFSPPGSLVRVGGRRADDSYLLRIVDDGVGINPDRLAELNELLREPPIVGLSVESTLGISVVSLLANKHGINVMLSAGSPGLTVDVVLPSSLFGPMDAPADQPGARIIEPALPHEMATWNDHAAAAVVEPTVAPEPAVGPEPLRIPEPAAADPLRIPELADETAPAVTDEHVTAEPVESAAGAAIVADTAASAGVGSSGPTTMSLDASSSDTPVAGTLDLPTRGTTPQPTTGPVEPVAAEASDRTTMSLDLSSFDATPATESTEPADPARPDTPAMPTLDAAQATESIEPAAPETDPVVAPAGADNGDVDEASDRTTMSLDLSSFDATRATESTEPAAPETDPVVAPNGADNGDVVEASDWTTMSLDLSSFDATPAAEPADPTRPDAPAVPTLDAIPATGSTEPAAPETDPVVAPAGTDNVDLDEAPDWTTMSLDLSSFDAIPATGSTEQADPTRPDQPGMPTLGATPADEQVAEPTPTPVAQPVADVAPDQADQVEPALPAAPAAAAFRLPPPGAMRAEFNVPPAPPITAGGISQRPVSPATARPAPVPTPSADRAPALPTRTQRGTGPEGPDRLATSDDHPVTTSEPGALQAALSAFDSGRSAVNAPVAGSLPTRERTGDPSPFAEQPQAVTQRRVDPIALRDRLRAFQSEFSNASGDHAGGSDIYTDQNDLGGDPR